MTDLTARLNAAARLSRTIRTGSEARRDGDEPGRVLTVAGSKGGVGTTTLATQLAFLAASDEGRRACLVDLDFFGGDLAGYVGLRCVAVDPGPAGRLRRAQPGGAATAAVRPRVGHPHPLRARRDGRRRAGLGEPGPPHHRRAPGDVRRGRHRHRCPDDREHLAGGRAGRPGAGGRHPRPPLPPARPTAWSRGGEAVDVRSQAVELLLNRTHRQRAVQPRLVGQVSALPVGRIAVPDVPGVMERLANEGASGLRSHRVVARPLQRLAVHLQLVPARRGWFAPLWRRHERGTPLRPGDRHRQSRRGRGAAVLGRGAGADRPRSGPGEAGDEPARPAP